MKEKEDVLLRRLKRERRAREAAEKIIEEKSAELYQVNQRLQAMNGELNKALSTNVNKLRQSQTENFALVENAVIGVLFYAEGRVVKMNPAFSEMLGYEGEDLYDIELVDFIFEKDMPVFDEIAVSIRKEVPTRLVKEIRLKTKNGNYLWTKVQTAPILDDEDIPKLHLFFVENIQKDKEYEAKQQSLIGELQEINDQLGNFAHVVSHDLKAPLNSVNTLLEWIREHHKQKPLDAEVHEFFELIGERIAKMYKLIHGVMDYSKVARGEEVKECFNVREAVEEAVSLITIPNHISVKFKGEFPTIHANPMKLKQVFMNLIDNASRHNDKKEGFIEIGASENDRFWIFTVEDNGIGIAKRHFDKIFKLFNTLDTSGKQTGIGLALVSKVVELYKGKVTVTSELGVGTTFELTLNKKMVQKPN